MKRIFRTRPDLYHATLANINYAISESWAQTPFQFRHRFIINSHGDTPGFYLRSPQKFHQLFHCLPRSCEPPGDFLGMKLPASLHIHNMKPISEVDASIINYIGSWVQSWKHQTKNEKKSLKRKQLTKKRHQVQDDFL